jgi:hypothetical protein
MTLLPRDVLQGRYEGIEVAYNAVGILCNLLADSPDSWPGSAAVSIGEILHMMVCENEHLL